MKKSKYTEEQQNYIKDNYKGITAAELARRVNAEFNTEYTAKEIYNYTHYHELKSGVPFCFAKGHTPHNKGKKWADYMTQEAQERARQTTKKPGEKPANTKEEGSERKTKDCYLIKRNGRWVPKARVVWEKERGAIPDNCVVYHINGDRYDDRLENLILMTGSEKLEVIRLKKNIDITTSEEIAESVAYIAKLKSQIRKRSRNE